MLGLMTNNAAISHTKVEGARFRVTRPRPVQCGAALFYFRDAWFYQRKPRKYCRIMSRHDQPRVAGNLLHALLSPEVRLGIERLRNRHVLFEIFVEIHV